MALIETARNVTFAASDVIKIASALRPTRLDDDLPQSDRDLAAWARQELSDIAKRIDEVAAELRRETIQQAAE